MGVHPAVRESVDHLQGGRGGRPGSEHSGVECGGPSLQGRWGLGAELCVKAQEGASAGRQLCASLQEGAAGEL